MGYVPRRFVWDSLRVARRALEMACRWEWMRAKEARSLEMMKLPVVEEISTAGSSSRRTIVCWWVWRRDLRCFGSGGSGVCVVGFRWEVCGNRRCWGLVRLGVVLGCGLC